MAKKKYWSIKSVSSCLQKIDVEINNNKEEYVKKFGLVPEFKTCFHVEEVTVSEMDIIKKDIGYTGDVLNTTARIQAQCNDHQSQNLDFREVGKKVSS
ncbi:hypothetical protein [Allomuricauda sp. SCSIO 65647]|uniref:hypothetical protein n=1 Tax=Allomuricauda sp. SCSIO 65647 TaxID=2908843 RepID=UPI001F292879|nr:hypothetical protein [Muricauda sp. SCSIO 65647]UJH66406.1 hypothetical protein L0P89_10545 [Muricauda sp. SCSIO 65647]